MNTKLVALLRAAVGGRLARGEILDFRGGAPCVAPPTVKMHLTEVNLSTARFYGDGFFIAPPTVKMNLTEVNLSTARFYGDDFFYCATGKEVTFKIMQFSPTARLP